MFEPKDKGKLEPDLCELSWENSLNCNLCDLGNEEMVLHFNSNHRVELQRFFKFEVIFER